MYIYLYNCMCSSIRNVINANCLNINDPFLFYIYIYTHTHVYNMNYFGLCFRYPTRVGFGSFTE